ncbi:MmcQ/YjbR family DNA-binding protein [Teredinibacter franksiae]|uniref:MmcQ/YjbR family DNA-binding protein n=1 Tax=Teredinibacter franksiae TaxID=2761453 RepID=UPI0016257ECE|nr:MmcQ/YjbR family DNA-binding protein [Teredinibacter franksiae]
MDEKATLKYALLKPEATEDFPFGPEARVFKVRDKMFGLISHCEWQGKAAIARLNLKCEPQQALMLRDIFPSVLPGYHMNKKHWNSVILDGSVPQGEIERMIDHSYTLVVKGLKKNDRTAMEIRWGVDTLYR